MQQEDVLSRYLWWLFVEGGSSNDSDGSSDETEPKESQSQKEIDKQVEDALKGKFSEEVIRNGYRYLVEWYPSIPAMLEIIKKRPHNDYFKDKNSSHEEGFERTEFMGTSSYKEAEELCLYGYEPAVKFLEEKMEDIICQYNLAKKSHLHESVIGYAPNVPKVLMNLPDSMIFRELDKVESRTLHIVFCNTVTAREKTSNMKQAGVRLLAVIKILEMEKINVRLDICFDSAHSTNSREAVFNILRLKDYDEQLDLLKLSFPLVHPSMARRIGFAAIETFPGIKGEYDHYGLTMEIGKHREALELHDNIIVFNVDSLNQYHIEQIIQDLKNGMAN